jgi:hypothetical protein
MTILGLLTRLLMLSVSGGDGSNELLPPVPLLADGKPLDVARDGHSAPFVGDFDGDGKRDLLVGQYHEGRLRIYRNRDANARPRFDDFTWFEAEGRPGRVPEG